MWASAKHSSQSQGCERRGCDERAVLRPRRYPADGVLRSIYTHNEAGTNPRRMTLNGEDSSTVPAQRSKISRGRAGSRRKSGRAAADMGGEAPQDLVAVEREADDSREETD